MDNTATRRAPEPTHATGGIALGTIGFDLYLAALQIDRRQLQPARVPTA